MKQDLIILVIMRSLFFFARYTKLLRYFLLNLVFYEQLLSCVT